MPKSHAQSLSLTVRNLYVQYRLLFLFLSLLIVMDVSQYYVYIKSVYHACFLKRLADRRRAADAVHSFLHKNVCDLLIVCKHFAHCCFFCDFHDLCSPFWIFVFNRNFGSAEIRRSYSIIITAYLIIASPKIYSWYFLSPCIMPELSVFHLSSISALHRCNTGSAGSVRRSMRPGQPGTHLRSLFFRQQT